MLSSNFKFGLLSEYLVMLLYIFQCCSIIGHRVRNFAGEIDVICQRAKLLIFVEVKARSSTFDDVILKKQQQDRVRRAAEVFLQHNPKYNGFNMRFDLVIVRPYKLPQIIKNAF